MITTFYNRADIDHAIQEIWADGHVPIMYTSEKNVNKLASSVMIGGDCDFKDSDKLLFTGDEFVGKDKGCYIYKTDKVGDLYVIVPMPFRKIKIEEEDE